MSAAPASCFWVFHVIRDYARTLDAGRQPLAPTICRAISTLAGELEAAQVPLPIVFGHNDLLPANFLDDGKRLWLIDFEYAGFGTAMFDLAGAASNAGMDEDQAQRLLAAYFGTPPDAAMLRAFDAMQCASLLREAMWAHGVGTASRRARCRLRRLCRRKPRPASTPRLTTITETREDRIMTLPSQAQIVVIGGGIIGCSTAYHLARDHKADVVLLEQGKLTSGSTWHAAGLVGQLRSSASITQVLKYSVDLYKRLDAETGLETGWKMTGCLRLATNEDRWTEYRRLATTARSFGMEMHLLSPEEVKRDVAADGCVRSGRRKLAADRRAGQPVRHHPVAGQGRADAWREDPRRRARHRLRDGRRPDHRVEDQQGEIACEKVVNCAGQWARQVGAMAGINVPLQPVKHQYIITEQIDGLAPDAPTLRDPDRRTYFKEEVGGLVMGGYEPNPQPWTDWAMCRTTGNSACSTTIWIISSSTWNRPSPASRRWKRRASSR